VVAPNAAQWQMRPRTPVCELRFGQCQWPANAYTLTFAVLLLTVTLIASVTPPQRRGMALGIWGATAGLGAALGPVIGGAVTDAASWQWIFWINVPVGMAVLPLLLLARESRSGAGPLDPAGGHAGHRRLVRHRVRAGPRQQAGAGLGFFFAPITRLTLGYAPGELEGIASGTSYALRQVGTVLGIAVLGSVFSAVGGLGSPGQFTTGLTAALTVSAAILGASALVVMLAPETRPARAARPPAAVSAGLAVPGSGAVSPTCRPGAATPRRLHPAGTGLPQPAATTGT
jgi:MFS family permease